MELPLRNVNKVISKSCLFIISILFILPAFSQNLSEYQIQIIKNMNGEYGDIKGNIAVGENAKLTSYYIGFGASVEPLIEAIVTAGKVNYQYGAVAEGDIITAGVSQVINVDASHSTIINNANSLPASFEAETMRLESLSQFYANYPVTGVVTKDKWNLEFKGDCQSDIQIFNIDARELSNSLSFTLDCIPDNASIIINVRGDESRFLFKNFHDLDNRIPKVLFNFYEAHSISMFFSSWSGSILAPNAEMNSTFVSFKGQLISKVWNNQYVTAEDVRYDGFLPANSNNEPLIIISEPPVTAQAAVLYSYTIDAAGLNKDKLSYSLSSAPAGMILNDNVVSWSPTVTQAGKQTYIITASDGHNAITQEIEVFVSLAPNTPLEIISEPVITASENSLYTYLIQVVGRDTSARKLTYILNSSPEGMSIVGNKISWIPNFKQAGLASVTLSVSDGITTAAQHFSLFVTNNNRSPFFTSRPVITATENQLYTYHLKAVDADQQMLTYRLDTAPEGMHLNMQNMPILNWVPNFEQAGDHKVVVSVLDGESVISQIFTISVANINRAPVIVSIAPTQVKEGQFYKYNIEAVDDDNDPLSYQLINKPSGMIIVDNLISWTPTHDDSGEHVFVVRVNDGITNVDQEVIISVASDDNGDDDINIDSDDDSFNNNQEISAGSDPYNADSIPDIIAPTISVTTANNQRVIDTFLVIQGVVNDVNSGYNFGVNTVVARNEALATDFSLVLTNNQFSGNVTLIPGKQTIIVKVTDNAGNQTSTSINIERLIPPKILSVTPSSGSVIQQESIVISGIVQSYIDDISVLVGNQSAIIEATANDDEYSFSITGYPLNFVAGDTVNTLQIIAHSTTGVDTQTLQLNFMPPNPNVIALPEIILYQPVNNATLKSDNFQLQGLAFSHAGKATLLINGIEQVTNWNNVEGGQFDLAVSFNGQNTIELELEVRDALNRSVSQTLVFYKDEQAPSILIDQPWLKIPTLNTIVQQPIIFSGTVSDSQIASLTLNDIPIRYVAMGNNQYQFNESFSITAGSTQNITLRAVDYAGNESVVGYYLFTDESVRIKTLFPVVDNEYISDAAYKEVEFAAKLQGFTVGMSVSVKVNTIEQIVSMNNDLVSGIIQLPAGKKSNIQIQVSYSNNEVIAEKSYSVSVIYSQDILLTANVMPINNAQLVEVNELIVMRFNKVIDQSLLHVEVKENLTGLTYLNNDDLGDQPSSGSGYMLAQVNRVQEHVDGDWVLNANKTLLTFEAKRYFGYGATIFIDATYDKKPIVHQQFFIRPTPTSLQGIVIDQLGQPVENVSVQLSGINRKYTTNSDGAFIIGVGEIANKHIAGGDYTLIINNDQSNSNYGVEYKTIHLTEGQHADFGTLRLLLINKEAGYDLLSEGKINVLSKGSLIINLQQAELQFIDESNAGSVNVQLLQYNELDLPFKSIAFPEWLFSLQPGNIRVSGNVQISVQSQNISGGTNFFTGQWALMVGIGRDGKSLGPIGAMQIQENGLLVSQRIEDLTKLDYFGFVPIPTEYQEIISRFAHGEITLIDMEAKLQ